MATKPLKSIKFPGLDDTYIVPNGTQTVTFEWADRWYWNRDRYPIEPNTMIIADFGGLLEQLGPITSEMAKLHHIYDWDGDSYPVISNKVSVPADFFAAKHAFFYTEGSFYLLDMIPAVNNGINVGVGHTADAHYLYDPQNNSDMISRKTPILVGLMESTNKSEQGVEAFVNREKPITANLEIGSINAPGGLIAQQPHDFDIYGDDEPPYIQVSDTAIRLQGYINSDEEGIRDWGYSDWTINNEGESLTLDSKGYSRAIIISDNGTIFADEGCFQTRAGNIETENGNFISGEGNIEVGGNVYAGTPTSTLRRIPHTYYGTTPPDNALGVDGDVYIMYSV